MPPSNISPHPALPSFTAWAPCAIALLCLLPVSLRAAGLSFEKTEEKADDPPAKKPASAAPDKAKSTPAFCQKDGEAGFADEGSNYCAPTSISNGLIYLSQLRGLSGLTDGTSHDDQIALIKELAEDMNTDPKSGTDPDRILTGLKHYVQEKGFHLKRLEIATWRPLGAGNKSSSLGPRPKLEWMRRAAADPDSVVVFNVGWYREEEGGYSRHGGHWISVVGAGSGTGEFSVHNPLLSPETQRAKTAVALTLLDDEFKIINSEGDEAGNMKGYFRVDGPGVPFGGKTSAAVLDSVIVFSVTK